MFNFYISFIAKYLISVLKIIKVVTFIRIMNLYLLKKIVTVFFYFSQQFKEDDIFTLAR